jgi:hypothetical protein
MGSANSAAALVGGLGRIWRALPMPAGAYLAAKLVTAAVFATALSLLLVLLGATVGKIVLELAQWASLFIFSVLGVIPFSGLGPKLTQYAVGAADGEFLRHVLDLAGMGVLFFALGRRAFRKVR